MLDMSRKLIEDCTGLNMELASLQFPYLATNVINETVMLWRHFVTSCCDVCTCSLAHRHHFSIVCLSICLCVYQRLSVCLFSDINSLVCLNRRYICLLEHPILLFRYRYTNQILSKLMGAICLKSFVVVFVRSPVAFSKRNGRDIVIFLVTKSFVGNGEVCAQSRWSCLTNGSF